MRSGLLNPITFEILDGKFESAGGSRMEGLDDNGVEGMIGIARRIAQDYGCGFGRTGDEKGCGEWDLSAKLITLPKEYN